MANSVHILKAGFFIDSSQYCLADAASVPVISALCVAVIIYPHQHQHITQTISKASYRHRKSRSQHHNRLRHRTKLPRPPDAPIFMSLGPEEIKKERASKYPCDRNPRPNVIRSGADEIVVVYFDAGVLALDMALLVEVVYIESRLVSIIWVVRGNGEKIYRIMPLCRQPLSIRRGSWRSGRRSSLCGAGGRRG